MLQCIIHSVHRGLIPFLRYPIRRFAFWQIEEMISAEAPPPPRLFWINKIWYKMQGCQQHWVAVNIRAGHSMHLFFPSSPNHYFIIWLMLPRCCQNAYTFPQRWKTNRGNLFHQIRYWSQLVCRASDIFPEKWMSNGKHHYFFLFSFSIKEASIIAMRFVHS